MVYAYQPERYCSLVVKVQFTVAALTEIQHKCFASISLKRFTCWTMVELNNKSIRPEIKEIPIINNNPILLSASTILNSSIFYTNYCTNVATRGPIHN